MSEAGSTRFPEPPRLPAGLQPGNSKDHGRTALLITALRDENGQTIRNTGDKPIKIEGEIQEASENGKIRLKTESGTVEIELARPEGHAKTPLLRPGMKIEIEVPPERQRTPSSGEIQAQIRVREQTSAPPQQTPAPEAVEKSGIPYAPRPDVYTPPAKAPEQLTPQEIARNLIGVTVRINPVPPEHYQALQTQILNTPPPVILPEKLTAQIHALAQSLPLQIVSEQSTLLQNTQMAIKTSIETLRPANHFFELNQSSIQQTLTAISPQNTLKPEPTSIAPAITTLPNKIISEFIQPIDIKSNFLFLSPQTLKASALELAPPLLNNFQAAPSPLWPTGLAEESLPKTVFTTPITAVFKNIHLPPALLQPPPSDAELSTTSLPPIKADNFAIPNIILNQGEMGQLTLTVQGTTIQNLPIVSLQMPASEEAFSQSFILQAPLGGFPAGSIIELTPLTHAAQTLQGVQQAAMAQAMTLLPPIPLSQQGWPLLDDILQTLQGSAGAASTTPAGAMLPSPSSPSQMGPMALFVIAALRSGDFSQVLSERAQNILKVNGKGGLISRLAQEGQALNRTEPLSQDWRAMTLPLVWDNEINKVILYYKQDNSGEGDQDNEKGKHARFIFDLDLSRMGKVQLDGLFRDKRMDMILRTHEPFSRAMQIHIQNGYNNALELTGLNGDISFQNDPKNWVHIETSQNRQFKTNI